MNWINEKPNKDGLWLWRIKDRPAGVGVILVEGSQCTERTWIPNHVYSIDSWYTDNLEVRYVGDEE